MAEAVLKTNTLPRWPAALITSLGLHLAALIFAVSDAPRRLSDPMIEVEVRRVQVDLPATPSPGPTPSAPAGGDVVARRRIPVTKLAVSRTVRTPSAASHAESPASAPTAEPVATEPAATDGVIVGKTAAPQAAAPSPGPEAAPRLGPPKTVAPAVGDGLLAINPNDPHYKVSVPLPLNKPGASFLTRLKFCVSAEGAVDKVTVITSSEPTLDSAILEKARLYRFHPYFDQGRPIPFCFYREYRLSIQD
jgi:hypothetical protein